MVCLRTGTMGVHPACFFIDRAGKVATPERNLAGENSLYLAHPHHHRAPTGGRQAFFSTGRNGTSASAVTLSMCWAISGCSLALANNPATYKSACRRAWSCTSRSTAAKLAGSSTKRSSQSASRSVKSRPVWSATTAGEGAGGPLGRWRFPLPLFRPICSSDSRRTSMVGSIPVDDRPCCSSPINPDILAKDLWLRHRILGSGPPRGVSEHGSVPPLWRHHHRTDQRFAGAGGDARRRQLLRHAFPGRALSVPARNGHDGISEAEGPEIRRVALRRLWHSGTQPVRHPGDRGGAYLFLDDRYSFRAGHVCALLGSLRGGLVHCRARGSAAGHSGSKPDAAAGCLARPHLFL